MQPNKKSNKIISFIIVILFLFVIFWVAGNTPDSDDDIIKNNLVSVGDLDTTDCANFRNQISEITNLTFEIQNNDFKQYGFIENKVPYCEVVNEVDTKEENFQGEIRTSLYEYLTKNGWVQNNEIAADGVDGGILGFDNGDITVIIDVHYTDKYDDCPPNLPVGNCDTRGKTAHHIAIVQLLKNSNIDQDDPTEIINHIIPKTNTISKITFLKSLIVKYPNSEIKECDVAGKKYFVSDSQAFDGRAVFYSDAGQELETCGGFSPAVPPQASMCETVMPSCKTIYFNGSYMEKINKYNL